MERQLQLVLQHVAPQMLELLQLEQQPLVRQLLYLHDECVRRYPFQLHLRDLHRGHSLIYEQLELHMHLLAAKLVQQEQVLEPRERQVLPRQVQEQQVLEVELLAQLRQVQEQQVLESFPLHRRQRQ
jgi:hypothetical protein